MDDGAGESAPHHKSCRAPLSAYDGCLLRLALDLGRRLLPAFLNPVTQREGRGQGLPYAWVNLRTRLTENEVTETCTLSHARDSSVDGLRRVFDFSFFQLLLKSLARSFLAPRFGRCRHTTA